jgi:hypothetical protein
MVNDAFASGPKSCLSKQHGIQNTLFKAVAMHVSMRAE